MNKPDNRILEVGKEINWIGVLDYDIVTFDIVMETRYGTTYNSYLINGNKKALIETVKEKFSGVWLEKIRSLTDPSAIDYLIMNHTEPDHSGSLLRLLELNPDITVVGSGNAIRYLHDMVSVKFKSMVVKDGDNLDLGDRKLSFISAPNLHWPDTMYTYIESDKLLFTCDSFGSHFCHEEMYDDLVGDFSEAFEYYFNVILKPFSKFMLKAIEKIRPLSVDTICTGHGPILRTSCNDLVSKTEKMASEYIALITGRKVKKILMTYVSAYGYTKEMASAIASGAGMVEGVETKLLDIEHIDMGELESEIVKTDALLVGSPTINQNTLLPVYRLFSVINPLRDRGKLAAAFGSYGWSGEASVIIRENLSNLKLNDFGESASFKFLPDEDTRMKLNDFGKRFATRLKSEK